MKIIHLVTLYLHPKLPTREYLRHKLLIVTFKGDKEAPILYTVMVLTLFN